MKPPTLPPRATITRPELSAATLASLRSQLEEQRAFRIDQLRMLCVTRVRPKRSTREIVETLKTGARAALRDVNAALARMDAGTYGRCTCCAAPLPLARLEILPHAAQCMACQQAAEVA